MSKDKTGGAAFPTESYEYDGQNNVLPYQEGGMTLRDYFAAKAMQGLCANQRAVLINDVDFRYLAADAFRMADAMLAERDKGE